jgi:hypothetical protein
MHSHVLSVYEDHSFLAQDAPYSDNRYEEKYGHEEDEKQREPDISYVFALIRVVNQSDTDSIREIGCIQECHESEEEPDLTGNTALFVADSG